MPRFFRRISDGMIVRLSDDGTQDIIYDPVDHMQSVTPGRGVFTRIGAWTIRKIKNINWHYVMWYFLGMVGIAVIIMWILFKPRKDYMHYNKYRWNE